VAAYFALIVSLKKTDKLSALKNYVRANEYKTIFCALKSNFVVLSNSKVSSHYPCTTISFRNPTPKKPKINKQANE
jgi:hypothetical protein